jgi:hypothetical protein
MKKLLTVAAHCFFYSFFTSAVHDQQPIALRSVDSHRRALDSNAAQVQSQADKTAALAARVKQLQQLQSYAHLQQPAL